MFKFLFGFVVGIVVHVAWVKTRNNLIKKYIGKLVK